MKDYDLCLLDLEFEVIDSLSEVRDKTESWIDEYNNERPHESLGNLTPMEHAANM